MAVMFRSSSAALRFQARRPGAWLAVCLAAGLFCAASARADLQVDLRRDVVELVDGTRIECIVLIETRRGVLVAVADPKREGGSKQEFIPADKIRKITRGEGNGQMQGFQTEVELCQKVIQGTGFRPPQPATKKDETPVVPAGPIQPAQPVNPAQPAPAQPLTNRPAPKLSPKELTSAYFSRFPALREAAEQLLGGSANLQETLQRSFEGDPGAREQLEKFLELYLQSSIPAAPAAGEPTVRKPEAPKPPGGKPKPKPAPPAAANK